MKYTLRVLRLYRPWPGRISLASVFVVLVPSMLGDGVRDRHTVMVQPHAASDLQEEGSIESDLIRFEEDVSPAPRAAECARFLLLVLPAGMVGGRGKRGCVIGGGGRGRRQEDTAALQRSWRPVSPVNVISLLCCAVLWTATIKIRLYKRNRE